MSVAQDSLRKSDPVMAALIGHVGKTRVRSEAGLTVFQSLVRAIAYQMISTKAAAAIHSRLLDVCGAEAIEPDDILELGEQGVRDVGFSRAKVTSLIDLATKCSSGEIPDDKALNKLDDKELVTCLTKVRGIGVWSVEMLMIFNLRRSDVFPATDLGVRRGHMLAYDLDNMLDAKALLDASTVWQPYRSVAAWYLWRANDCVDWDSVRAPDTVARKSKTGKSKTSVSKRSTDKNNPQKGVLKNESKNMSKKLH